MNNVYCIYSVSKLYREEALRDANERHLIGLARAGRSRPGGLGRSGLGWSNLLSLLRLPGFSE